MRRIFAAFVLALVSGCGDGGPVSQLFDADEPRIPTLPANAVIRIIHKPCYGTCPVYVVTLFDSGKTIFEGDRFVKTTGSASHQLSPETVRSLVSHFADSSFPRMDTFYSHGHANCLTYSTDQSGTITTVRLPTGVKSVYYNRGCATRPELAELTQNQQEVERAANVSEWVGAG